MSIIFKIYRILQKIFFLHMKFIEKKEITAETPLLFTQGISYIYTIKSIIGEEIRGVKENFHFHLQSKYKFTRGSH